MKFSNEVSKEIAELMLEIQDALLLNKKGTTWFAFNIFPDEKDSDGDYNKGLGIANRRKEVLGKIAELGALNMKLVEDGSPLPSHSYQIRINREKFDSTYRDFIGSSNSDSLEHRSIVFYIDDNGDFWLEPKANFLYSMGAKSDRYKILKYLVDNPDFRTTDELSELLNAKDKQVIRSEIGKIKRNIKKFLKIGAADVIESKKGSGYRINPKCKVAKM